MELSHTMRDLIIKPVIRKEGQTFKGDKNKSMRSISRIIKKTEEKCFTKASINKPEVFQAKRTTAEFSKHSRHRFEAPNIFRDDD